MCPGLLMRLDITVLWTVQSYGQYTVQQKDFSNWGGGARTSTGGGGECPPCPMLATPLAQREKSVIIHCKLISLFD